MTGTSDSEALLRSADRYRASSHEIELQAFDRASYCLPRTVA
jgi:hypothetical protein